MLKMALGTGAGMDGPDVELLGVRAGNPISEHIFLKLKCSIPHPSSLTPPCSQLQTAYVQFSVLKISFWVVSKCADRWEGVAA